MNDQEFDEICRLLEEWLYELKRFAEIQKQFSDRFNGLDINDDDLTLRQKLKLSNLMRQCEDVSKNA